MMTNNKNKKVKLTETQAILLYTLFNLVREGEFVFEFSAEKICYFLQYFGAKKYFKLEYNNLNFCGPYSWKVKYALKYLNGSYISGFKDLNQKPFEPLLLISDTYEDIKKIVANNNELYSIAEKTNEFLTGFYSDFTLELLSTVHYIMKEKQTDDIKIIKNELDSWNEKKGIKSSNYEYLKIAVDHLKKFNI